MLIGVNFKHQSIGYDCFITFKGLIMIKRLLPLSLTFFLTAFTSSFQPHLTQDPIKVNQETIGDYWISKNDIQFGMRPTNAQLRLMKSQKVEIIARYLVDSNGNVFDLQILESNVDISFENLVQNTLSRREFEVAKTNSSRQPIIATSSFVYSYEGKSE